MIKNSSFVAVTCADFGAARRFWVDGIGFAEVESGERHFIVDAGGLRLSFDQPDDVAHVAAGTDPVLGFRVASVPDAVAELRERGLEPTSGPDRRAGGSVVTYRDPDGRCVVLEDF